MSRLALNKPAAEFSYVACAIAETTFAIAITRVREITQPMRLTTIPEAPPTLLGAVDHRGEVVPVVDPGVAMSGAVTQGPRRKWVMVRNGDRTLGVVVRQVFEVFRVRENEIRRSPEMGRVAAYTTLDVVDYERTMAFVLDLDAVARLVNHPTPGAAAIGAASAEEGLVRVER
ncbi:MAG TPA: chemotaxis protein CheW [Polyangiaceae bacterium]|nr:chemotaxis protein CheW [Polyangiaceae bacterium]